MAMTYSSFVSDLAGMGVYNADDADFLAEVPRAITYAEKRLYRDLPKARHNYLQVVDFDDPRFSEQRTAQGAWQPLDFLSEVGYGLYLLEPWDENREPIVLLPGINSSPTIWAARSVRSRPSATHAELADCGGAGPSGQRIAQ